MLKRDYFMTILTGIGGAWHQSGVLLINRQLDDSKGGTQGPQEHLKHLLSPEGSLHDAPNDSDEVEID